MSTEEIDNGNRERILVLTMETKKKSKIDGDDGDVAFAGENNGGGAYRDVRERICTEKRKKKPITVVEQQKQVRGGAAEADPWWRRRIRSVVEEKLYGRG